MSAKLEVAVQRASQAEALLRNELLSWAFKELERRILETWGSTTLPERDAREKLWLACQTIGDVRNLLHLLVRDGKIAQQDLERMAGLNRAA